MTKRKKITRHGTNLTASIHLEFIKSMKPRFSLSFYPLSGGRLWIVRMITEYFRDNNGDIHKCIGDYRTTLDAEETAAFWKY